MARVDGEVYHARGIAAKPRYMAPHGRTVERAYDGMAWLSDGM